MGCKVVEYAYGLRVGIFHHSDAPTGVATPIKVVKQRNNAFFKEVFQAPKFQGYEKLKLFTYSICQINDKISVKSMCKQVCNKCEMCKLSNNKQIVSNSTQKAIARVFQVKNVWSVECGEIV